MKWSVIRRKLERVDRALAKAVDKGETPGVVVRARMPREGEVVEYEAVLGNAVVKPERIAMARDTMRSIISIARGTTSSCAWRVRGPETMRTRQTSFTTHSCGQSAPILIRKSTISGRSC